MDKFCIPIEKPEGCWDCKHCGWSYVHDSEYCDQLNKSLSDTDAIDPDCPIVPMPDVEGLKRKLAVYEEAFEFVVSNSCPPHEICIAHETRNDDCEPCYREYLESKLKESDNWQAG